MAQVCLLGDEREQVRYELLSRETAREALSTYDLREPYENTIALETVSIGAAVALLNDLNWYLVRFVRDALVQSDSVSEHEWLSRGLATAIRDGDVAPEETGEHLRLYGIEESRLVDPIHVRREDVTGAGSAAGWTAESADETSGEPTADDNDDPTATDNDEPSATGNDEPPATGNDEPSPNGNDDTLAEGNGVPEREGYDDLLVVRITESEFRAA